MKTSTKLKRNSAKVIVVLLLNTLLGACATAPENNAYLQHNPPLNLFNFFEGKTTAWGIVQDRKGRVTQRFRVDITGKVQGETLTLDEHFHYFLGEGIQRRIWEITRNAADDRSQSQSVSFVGKADDIVGEANGESLGNALNWTYKMDLTVSSGSYRVKFDDWMWLVDENTLVNRAYIKKFGLVMAEVTLFMQKNSSR